MSPPDLAATSAASAALPALRGRGSVRAWADARAWLALASAPWLLVWALPPLNHDVAALLLFTDRWLGGARLYQDLVDLNPPLVFGLYALPAAVSRAGLLGLAPAFTLGLVLSCAAIGALVWRRAARLCATPAEALMLAALLPAGIVALANTMGGQREHLLAVALLPWLFDAARRAGTPPGPRESVPVAVLAALGLCLKPHFLAIPVLVEGALLLRRGRAGLADPVPWTIAAVVAMYGLGVALLFPAYLNDVVPLILGVYAAFGETTPIDVLTARTFAPAALVLLAGAATALRGRDALARVLALAALGGAVGAAAQAKGWPYHYLPAELFTLLLAGRIGSTWLAGLAPAAAGQGVRLAVAALVAANAYVLAMREGPARQLIHHREPAAALAAEIAARAAGAPVLLLSPGVDPAYPALLEGGGVPVLRFMTLWPLQVAYQRCPADGGRYRAPSAMGAAERRVLEAIVADMRRHAPRLVLLDRVADVPDCAGIRFDILAYLLRDPGFAQAFAGYRLVREIDRFAIFTRPD